MSLDPNTLSVAQNQLDAHVREIIAWHFSPETGCPFWLDWAKQAGWDPAPEVQVVRRPRRAGSRISRMNGCATSSPRSGCRRISRAAPTTSSRPAAPPACPSSASAGTITRPTTRSSPAKLADEHFPRGAAWLMVGPTGPRRLRLAIEHLANFRGSPCYFVDLDPRWVKKVIAREEVRPGPRLHGPRCGPGRDPPPAPQDQRAIHHARSSSKHWARSSTSTRPASAACSAAAPPWRRNTSASSSRKCWRAESASTPPTATRSWAWRPARRSRPEDNFSITYYAPQPRAVLRVVEPRPNRTSSWTTAMGPRRTAPP